MTCRRCIVLVTAFMKYVLEGYKVGAVRYIMKDALDEQLLEYMDAVLKKMQFREVIFSFLKGGEDAVYRQHSLCGEQEA